LFLFAVGDIFVSANVSLPAVVIVTSPGLGPFRLGQKVEFTCEVDSSHFVNNISYQWRSVESVFGGSTYSTRSFNKTFHNNDVTTLRYCWFFCTVTYNGTFTASNNKLIEVQGKLSMIIIKITSEAEIIELDKI